MTLQNLKPADYLDIFLRRKWLISGVILCCVGIAWAVCLLLPKSYRSSTLVLVENQRIPERYVSPAIGGTVSERLTMINQYVLSRTVLGEIIGEFQLLGAEGNNGPKAQEEMLAAMRKNIRVETRGGGNRVEAFSISFSHPSPEVAMNVTGRLAAKFVDENLKSREELVAGTTEFLDGELSRAKEALEYQEDAIAQFKRKFMGELPGQMDANLHTLSRLEKELTGIEATLQNRADRRLAIQKMLQGYESLGLSMAEQQSAVPESIGNEGQSPSRVERRKGSTSLSSTEARLRELDRQLMALSAEYKSTYPDVVKIKQEIAQTKEALAKDGAGGVSSEEPVEETSAAVIAESTKRDRARREKKTASTAVDPYVFELKKELSENDIGIAALKEEQSRLRAQARAYQQRVERTPEREQELIVLQRDYDNTKKNYESLLEKKLNARISENLEKRQKGESFRILDPANLPTAPESPDETRIMLLGLVLGCGLGFGSALAMEKFMGVIRRPEDVESLLGLPVLATIPKFEYAYKGETRSGKTQVAYLTGQGEGLVPQSKASGQPLDDETKDRSVTGKVKPLDAKWSNLYGQASYGYAKKLASGRFSNEFNLVTKWKPRSLVSEQFRVAATRLVLLSGSQKGSTIVVTSSIPGEGKSSTACNIAYVLAHDLGKPTILIDCDFKKPSIHTYTAMPGQPGLAELLYGDMPLESCLHQKPDASNLWVLPAGRRDHRLVSLAKIPDLKKIVSDLKGRFEYLVLDTPPILHLADINLLAAMADILLFVVRAELTPQDVVEKAVKKLGVQGRSGIILNGCDIGPMATGYLSDYHHVSRGVYSG